MLSAEEADFSVALANIQVICNITKQRGIELLEASNGSLERAVDIFFHQQGSSGDVPTSHQGHFESIDSPKIGIPKNEGRKRPTPRNPKSTSPGKPAKQARLSSFFTNDESLALKSKNTTSFSETNVVDEISLAARENSTRKHPPEAAPIPDLFAPNIPKRRLPHKSGPDKVDVSFARFSKTLQEMSNTTKRTIKLEVLSNFIADFVKRTEEADKAYGLTCALKIVLGKAGDEPLGISGRIVSSALQDILGVPSRQLSKGYRESGDLGDAASSFFQEKKFFIVAKVASLSVVRVYSYLLEIVEANGGNAKKGIVHKLLRSCQSKSELRFMVRLLVGNMRIGCNLKTVLAAVAMAFHSIGKESTNKKAAVELVQKTHDLCPSLERILRALLGGGFDQVKKDCGIQVLTPIAPMLAHPVHSLEQVEKAMTEMKSSVVLEWKYDGVRCQAHFDGSCTKLFSRHLLETTAQYPDAATSLLGARKKSQNVKSFILDSEIVGVETDCNQTRLLPFQELSRRKKKDDGNGVEVKVFIFDIMFLNGESCIDMPLWERQRILQENFEETDRVSFVASLTLSSYDGSAIQDFLEESVRHGTEGLMVKMLGKQISQSDDDVSEIGRSSYESGTRSHTWLKVKRDYVKGYADTIDVVPIGAWHGTGRKAQRSFLSPVLLAVYDEDEDVYRSISRCMTFTDAMYDAMREFYLRGTPYPSDLEAGGTLAASHLKDEGGVFECDEEPLGSTEKNGIPNEELSPEEELVNCFPTRPSSAFVITNEQPKFWFKPLEVFEVSFADMTLSRQHTAAAGLVPDSEGRGVGLRFPRFKRRRPDKRPDQATTTTEIAAMFLNQSKQASSFSNRERI
eukprot:scaffold1474_cov132-Cylindrotheca_fusiformis.AAC.17